jgi:hypothetical protein
VPYLTTFADGKAPSLVPAWTHNHHNFMLLPGFGSNIDHDDGSSYYNDSLNVLVSTSAILVSTSLHPSVLVSTSACVR